MTLNNLQSPWTAADHSAENLLNELHREIVCGHPLWGKQLRAIAQRTDSDDVLFEIEGTSPSYAEVHLTWTGKPASDMYFPVVKLFGSMDEWLREGMRPDHKKSTS